MQCTPAEIEEKRRQAQLRLSRKKSTSDTNNYSSNLGANKSTHSPNAQWHAKAVAGTKTANVEYKSYFNSRPSNISPYNKYKQNTHQLTSNAKSVITGSCYLINVDKFAVEISTFHTPCIDIFKTIPSRSYNSKTRIWDFHIKDYDVLYPKLLLLQPNVIVSGLPQFVINCIKMSEPDYSLIDLSNIDPHLSFALMPFQEEGVCFGISKEGRCLIADDMGLGKTFQALALADYYREDWPLLIITTSSMKNTWEGTIHKFLPSVSIMDIQYMVSAKDYINDVKILIVSYDMMTRSLEKLMERKFGVLVIDESHTLKNFKAKCTKAAASLSKIARRVILLSGTPALSRPSELYSQLSMIDSKFFGSFFDYSKRYCDAKQTQFGWDSSGKSNLQELEIVLHKKFMIRRTKDEVLKSLPNKKRQVVTLDINSHQLKEEDRKMLKTFSSKCNQIKNPNCKHPELLRFFTKTATVKIPSVCQFLLEVLEENKKFIVFAHHKEMLDALQKVMSGKSKKFIRIDGNTTSEQRKYFIDKFQYKDDYVGALLSITAANAGITLTAAKLVIFAELPWNPSILSQAESRAHRIGQEEEVVVKYLVAPGTADDFLWPILQNKQDTLNQIGLFKETYNNVTVVKQEDLAQQLHPESKCKTKRMDITDYLKPLTDLTNSQISNELLNISDTTTDQEKETEMELLNDDLDDVLGNVNLNNL